MERWTRTVYALREHASLLLKLLAVVKPHQTKKRVEVCVCVCVCFFRGGGTYTVK
jgi:hypothetical protein